MVGRSGPFDQVELGSHCRLAGRKTGGCYEDGLDGREIPLLPARAMLTVMGASSGKTNGQ